MSLTWEDELAANISGYLLPESIRSTGLSPQEGARFLERLTLRPGTLELLRVVSVLSRHMESLKQFTFVELPSLTRELPSATQAVQRRWEGGFQGRLDVATTLKERMAGRQTIFVTRTRRRTFAIPENLVVRAVAERLLAGVTLVRVRKLVARSGWSSLLNEIEAGLRKALFHTVLKDVPLLQPSLTDETAATVSRHHGHRRAGWWAGLLREELDSSDPEAIAKVVAEGALLPLEDSARFEIAVLLRLARRLEAHFEDAQPGRWRVERSLVMSDRDDIVRLVRNDGANVRLCYNQAVLPSGQCDLGVRHYLDYAGRLRPDITVQTTSARGEQNALVIEVKLSDQRDYLARGYHEAVLYRHEYAESLRIWPKAVLVTSAEVSGLCRPDDDVIAVGWSAWPPEQICEAILRSVVQAQTDFAHDKSKSFFNGGVAK